MTKYEKILEALEEMRDNGELDQLVKIHNEHCDACGYEDDHIYFTTEFNEVMFGREPMDIAQCCAYGKHFNPNDNYFYFNGYANLESFDYIGKDTIISLPTIADYVAEYDDPLDDSDLQELLDKCEEEEEEE